MVGAMSSARGLAPLALALALCCLLAACSADELTEFIVVVDSDLAVPTALDEIAILVEGPSGILKTARASLTGADAVPLPVTLGLRPGIAGATAVTIRADGLVGGVRRLSREVRTSFVVGRRLVVRIALLSRCVDVVCGEGDTCTPDGDCASATVDPDTLPPFTGNVARVDMGPIDAGPLDLGPPDLGPPDLGPPDLGPPDLGPPIDAGPPSCDSLYGATRAYQLCEERATECEFYTVLDGGNCNGRCMELGGRCIISYDNGMIDGCVRGGAQPCGANRNDEICVCSR